MRPFRLLQITDCHLGDEPGEKLLGLDTDQSLHDVLVHARESCVRTNTLPDLIIATGDIANDAGEGAYQRFLGIVESYFPGIPMAWLPGNHDQPLYMEDVAPHPIENQHEVAGWNLIMLDSRIPMEEGGELRESELIRLEDELSARPSMPTLVFLHHQPVPVGSAWVDQYVVLNSDAFFQVLDRHSHVKAVIWGHVHQEFELLRKGVQLLATPSTCVQFVPNNDEFKVDHEMPGYRCFELHKDGKFVTEVRRISQKGYDIDYASAGY